MYVCRLMRAYTKREKVLKFVGCYHGHADSFLVQASQTVFYPAVYARHDSIIESACLWLEDVNPIQFNSWCRPALE